MAPGDATSFIESAIQGAESHAVNGGMNVADFNALQQATQEGNEVSDPASATSTAQAALGMYPTLHVPSSTEEQFAAQAAAESAEQQQQQQHEEHEHEQHTHTHPHEHEHEPTYDPQDVPHHDQVLSESLVSQDDQPPPNGIQQPQTPRYTSSGSSNPKPTVGSEEWHKMRKDNHKEVERRRRETINEGINELAKIVPGCEKNKGSILQRAVNFISQLKENEQQNIEKWTLEKLLTEQAITELSTSNDKLKQECERLYRELEIWKRVAQNAGLEPPQPKEETNEQSIAS